jgi:hypothetical protein
MVGAPLAPPAAPLKTSDSGAGWRWVPRTVLLPAYATVEYLLRRPTVGLVAWSERVKAFEKMERFFVHMGGRLIIFPTFYYEFGLRPSVGVVVSYQPWGQAERNGHQMIPRLDVGGAFWADDWTTLHVVQRFGWPRGGEVSANDPLASQVALLGKYESRPDRVFYGVGPDSRRSEGRFFRQRRSEIGVSAATWQRDLIQLGISGHFVTASFDSGLFPSINPKLAMAFLPGFAGYSLVGARVELALDTRYPFRKAERGQHQGGSGLRVDSFVAYDVAASDREVQFLKYGAQLGLFWDVSRSGHVLSVQGRFEMLTAIGDGAVPFTELPLLGGNETMQAFFEGRFRGASTFEMTGQYRYPIWTFLDAMLFAGVGNAFSQYLSDLSLARTHLVFGFGARTTMRRDWSIDFLIAGGTNRLDSSQVAIEQVRFVVGVNHGF